jgi:hypothetical protein
MVFGSREQRQAMELMVAAVQEEAAEAAEVVKLVLFVTMVQEMGPEEEAEADKEEPLELVVQEVAALLLFMQGTMERTPHLLTVC